MHSEIDEPSVPSGVAIFGSDGTKGEYFMLYFDERGVSRKIAWKGEWQGKKYDDRGVILKLEPERLIQYIHFSPLSGKPDLQENYHMATIELVSNGAETAVSLAQDNNETEQAREHSEKNWKMMLASLKKLLER